MLDKHKTSSSVNSTKYELDNTEIYDNTGRTIIDIQDIDTKEIMKMLEERKC